MSEMDKMSVEEMEKLADELFVGEGAYNRLFFSEGEMAATDGIIMLRVRDRRFHKLPGMAQLPALDLSKVNVRIGGEWWVFGELEAPVLEASREAEKRYEAAVADFEGEETDNSWRTNIVFCPCCGNKLVWDGSDVSSYEDYYLNNVKPNRRDYVGLVMLRGRDTGLKLVFDADYLRRAIAWARAAGGLKAVLADAKMDGTEPIRFDGGWWEVVLMSRRFVDEEEAKVVEFRSGGVQEASGVPAVRWRFEWSAAGAAQ